jgi:RNA polymerase sigma-70 factor (ECF subfamily)
LTLAFLEQTVELFYVPLFKFAHRLSGNPVDAADLTQETFYLAQTRGHQLHTPGRVKSWLFTTLYREFLKRRLRQNRFPEVALEEAEEDWVEADGTHSVRADVPLMLRALRELDERFRLPLKLFYLENKTYREIAAAVPLPIGTVMSRISRGKQLLASVLNPHPEIPGARLR